MPIARPILLLAVWAALALAWPCSPAMAVELRAEDLSPIALRAGLDNLVPELNLPVSGVRFLLVWKAEGETRVAELTSRRGVHAYEVRHLPGWSGTAEFVALSIFRGPPGSLGRLVRPDLAQEWDMLAARRQYLPVAVNRLDPQGFLGLSWDLLLLGLGGAGALACRLLTRGRRPVALALAAGLVLALAADDLRQLPGRLDLPAALDENRQVQMARQYAAWVHQVEPSLGDRPWDRDGLPHPLDLYTGYLMSGRPYRPGGAGAAVFTLRDGHPAVLLRQ